jgi:hypothetical protein
LVSEHEYMLLDDKGKRAIVLNSILELEQRHYSALVNVSLNERLGNVEAVKKYETQAAAWLQCVDELKTKYADLLEAKTEKPTGDDNGELGTTA